MRNIGREWLLERLTRRRAWAAIVFVLVWNLLIGGVLFRQALADDFPLSIVIPQLIIGVVLIIVVIVWLLRNSRPR